MSLERIGILEQRANHCDRQIGVTELRLNSHAKSIDKLQSEIDKAKGWVAAAVFFTSTLGSILGGTIVFGLYKFFG